MLRGRQAFRITPAQEQNLQRPEVAGCGVYSVDLALLTDFETRNHKRPHSRSRVKPAIVEPSSSLISSLRLVIDSTRPPYIMV